MTPLSLGNGEGLSISSSLILLDRFYLLDNRNEDYIKLCRQIEEQKILSENGFMWYPSSTLEASSFKSKVLRICFCHQSKHRFPSSSLYDPSHNSITLSSSFSSPYFSRLKMEPKIHDEDVLIAGAGIAGLTTALGLHRLGIRSSVLESSDGPRVTGFALLLGTNAWRALEAVGVGDSLRDKSVQIHGFKIGSSISSMSSPGVDKLVKFECRCVRRKDLLETLERELPQGTIRYSSKIVSIEESGDFKLVHLADGSVFRTKVLIGCDGVNSMVAKWLGLQDAVSAGRSAIRGFVVYPDGHGFEPKFHAYFGGGVRYGFVPCDDKSLYWFCTFTPSLFNYDVNEHDPVKMKQLVMSSIGNAEKRVLDVVERTTLDCISCAHLKLRLPWNVLLGNIVKDNVCVVGDALHPMTPDIGQGGCSSLEDSVVLARCLGEALSNCNEEQVVEKTKRGLEKYAKDRRWRSFSLISTAYVVGLIQESDNRVMRFLKRVFLAKLTMGAFLRMADYDCGKLTVS